MACPVCALEFTSVLRKQVVCASCAFESCQSCTKTYLLGTTQDAHCMNCRIAWSYNFLIDNFSKAFVNGDFKRHREDVLVEREKSLLVDTIHLVEKEKQQRTISQELKELRKELEYHKQCIKFVKQRIVVKSRELTQKEVTSIPRKQYIRNCPADGCKGFLSTSWECELCKVKACSKCHDIKLTDVEHVCDPDNVQTATAIMRDTKPCPKCGARIFKIDGCNQIWCTSCHTTFDWHTGKIDHGIIHNPHYFEYLRKTGARINRAADNGCGDVFVDARRLVYHLQCIRLSQDPHPLIRMLRGFSHIYRNQIPQIPDSQAEFANLRLRYLIGDFDEDHWKQQLQACEKRKEKRVEVRLILTTLITVATDIFQRVLKTKLPSEIEVMTNEMNGLIEHINDSFIRYASRFGCTSVKFIHPTKYTLESKPRNAI